MNKIYNGTNSLFQLLLCTLLFGSGISLQAQTTNAKETTNVSAINAPAKEGTYQLIYNSRKGDHEIILTPQQLILIEKLRKDDEVICALSPYADDIRIKILPRKVINSPNFKPVPLKYYKDEERYEEYHNFRYVELQ